MTLKKGNHDMELGKFCTEFKFYVQILDKVAIGCEVF